MRPVFVFALLILGLLMADALNEHRKQPEDQEWVLFIRLVAAGMILTTCGIVFA